MGCSYSWGNWASYHPTVDLAAPGENIHSTIIGTGYEAWDGSSMASPNAASCFGLLKAYYPNWTNQELMERMYVTADRVVYDQNPDYIDCNGNSGEDCFGYGMVDIYKAIGLTFSPNISIESTSINMVNDDDGVLNPGESAQLSIILNNEDGWTDANALFGMLSTDSEGVNIVDDYVQYGSLSGGVSFSPSDDFFEFEVSQDIDLGDIVFTLSLGAVGNDGYVYTNNLNLDDRGEFTGYVWAQNGENFLNVTLQGIWRRKGQVFEIVTLDQATDGNTIIARGILNFAKKTLNFDASILE